jgi:hypothetical protein
VLKTLFVIVIYFIFSVKKELLKIATFLCCSYLLLSLIGPPCSLALLGSWLVLTGRGVDFVPLHPTPPDQMGSATHWTHTTGGGAITGPHFLGQSAPDFVVRITRSYYYYSM